MYLPYLLQAIPGSFRTSTCLAALSLHAAFYVISVRQTRGLPSPSFRFHLSMDTLGVQLYPSHYRAGSGLSPVRFCPCREHQISLRVKITRGLMLLFDHSNYSIRLFQLLYRNSKHYRSHRCELAYTFHYARSGTCYQAP